MISEMAEYLHSQPDIDKAIGRAIESMAIEEPGFIVRFRDGSRLVLWDDGQSCCETRYITCDDELSGFDGARLVSVETRDVGPAQPHGSDDDDYDVHQVAFVVVATDRGSVTLCTHNVHNGYYDGFFLRASFRRSAVPL